MRRVPHSWREAYELALTESDPMKATGRVEYAMYTLERRYAEWGTDPGTPAELAAIRNCIAALARLMEQNRVGSNGAVLSTTGSSNGEKHDVSENPGKDADFAPRDSV